MSTNFAKTLVWKHEYDVKLWRHKQRTPNTNDHHMPLKENPPWKFSAYATEPKRYELRNSYLANVNFLSETRAFWTWHTSQDLKPETSITGKWIDLTSGELHDNLNVTFYFYTAHHQRLQFWRWKQEKQRCFSHPIVLACAKNSVVCVMQFRSMLRYGTIGFAGKPTARLN